MHNHRTKIIPITDGTFRSRCICRMQSPTFQHRWEAEDWATSHLGDVERVKASLARTPSLTDQRDYFRKQEQDATLPEADRRLWGLLRQELDHRLGTDHPPVEDDPLFDQ